MLRVKIVVSGRPMQVSVDKSSNVGKDHGTLSESPQTKNPISSAEVFPLVPSLGLQRRMNEKKRQRKHGLGAGKEDIP